MADSDKNLREAYTFARETRDHADTLLWQVSAIVWGGQTLLLGGVLAAIGGSSEALILVLVIAVIGMLMTRFNKEITSRRWLVCNEMIKMMRNIEDQLGMPVKPQQILSQAYPAGSQTFWSSLLNNSFGVAWFVVIIVALVRLGLLHKCIFHQ